MAQNKFFKHSFYARKLPEKIQENYPNLSKETTRNHTRKLPEIMQENYSNW